MIEFDKLENRARRFAIERHGHQLYGVHPYVVHLEAVRTIVVEAGYPTLAVPAWLHDTVEDTATSREDLEAEFGPHVAELVWAVTGVGQTRTERVQSAYAKIRLLPAACNLKLADRIANVEAASANSGSVHLERYRREAAGFSAALDGLGDDALWQRLAYALAR